MFSAFFSSFPNATANQRRSVPLRAPRGITIIIAAMALMAADTVQAQTTLTWTTPGVTADIGTGGNWVGGTPPNFAGDATTDSAIFSASTNTAVKLRNVTTGDPFATVTFEATAPAYNFSLPTGNTTNELVILPLGNITNNSANTQNLTGIAALTLNGATGAPASVVAANGNAGTKLSFDVSQLKFNTPSSTANGGAANTSFLDLTAGFDVRTNSIYGVDNAGAISTLFVQGNQAFGIPGDTANSGPTAGKLLITGDSGTNTGRVVVGIGGIVRISHNNALGNDGSASNVNATILLGGGRDGRVELTGNITTNEAFTLNGRQDNNLPVAGIRAPAILNVGGTNTLTGVFRFGGGGNAYNFGSDAGTLVIQSDLNMTPTFERYITFQGPSSIVVNGNIFSSDIVNGGDVTIVKYDSGTTTLNGSANDKIGHLSIRGGTLALGASAGITFIPIATDTFALVAPRVMIDAGTTFDVSAKVGGYNLTQTLQGSGTVNGSLIMASGTKVLPGATTIYDAQGMTVNDFADAVGTLTFQSGGMDLSAGSSMVWQLGALSTNNPGVDFDQIVNGGNLVLGGTSNIALDFSLVSDPSSGDPFWNTAHSWKIIDTTANTGGTNFVSITNGTFGAKHFTTTVGTGANAGDIFLNFLAGSAQAGDFDGDGDVDGADFVAWQTNFPTASGATLAQGDADGDGDVDGADFVVWQTNFPFTPGPGASPVPEPHAFILLAVGGLFALRRFRTAA